MNIRSRTHRGQRSARTTRVGCKFTVRASELAKHQVEDHGESWCRPSCSCWCAGCSPWPVLVVGRTRRTSRSRRVPGLDLDLEPAPRPTGPVDLRRALQHRSASPRPQPRHPRSTGLSRQSERPDQTHRPARRPPPRIPTSRLIKHLTCETAYLHPSAFSNRPRSRTPGCTTLATPRQLCSWLKASRPASPWRSSATRRSA